jgi:hypothetical protein
MKTNRGIVLIVLGDPFYGRMAFNLLLGLKHTEPEMPVTLIHDSGAITHLRPSQRKMFNAMVPCSPEHYMLNGKMQYYMPKLHLYELSPYKETIFLDADMLWLPRKKPSQLFDELAAVDFAMINEGYVSMNGADKFSNQKYTFWVDPNKIKEAYPDNKNVQSGKLFQYRSEFIYFRKNKESKKLFTLAQKIYRNPKALPVKMGEKIPDEYAFNIAGLLLGIEPHEFNYCPVYWEFLHGRLRLTESELYNRYYGYSMGGSMNIDRQKNFYNELVKYYSMHAHLQNTFRWENKINFKRQTA